MTSRPVRRDPYIRCGEHRKPSSESNLSGRVDCRGRMFRPPISTAPLRPAGSITLVRLNPSTSTSRKNPAFPKAFNSPQWTASSAKVRTERTTNFAPVFTHHAPRTVSRLLTRRSSGLGFVVDKGKIRSCRTALASMAVTAEGGRVLITFDVDGTLMQSTGQNANLLHKKSFAFAFKEVFGIDGTIDAIKHHGSTDPMVLINTLEYYGVPTEAATAKLPELKTKMLEYAKENCTQVGEGLELLPGVASLLETLSKRDNVVVALVTGNLEYIGWLKMEGLGIRAFFSTPNFGGFGSDHVERGELVRIAASRAKTLFPGEFSKRVHVGDTPNDIRAAEYGGALAIGVCTGVFSREDLLAASKSGSAVILDDLKDSALFLKACGLQ